MHQVVVTPGIVLAKRGVGEANTLVSLLTAELGLVRAAARSARLDRSKLRYGLEPLQSGRYSLVRGKYEWRLTGVERVAHEFAGAGAPRRAAAGRVARLLLRLVSGEEPLPPLYKTVAEGFTCLSCAGDTAQIEAIEAVLVLRILSHLGYLPQTSALEPYTRGDFTLELSAQALANRALLIRTINESLSATGL